MVKRNNKEIDLKSPCRVQEKFHKRSFSQTSKAGEQHLTIGMGILSASARS
jgi:hypothetical protein